MSNIDFAKLTPQQLRVFEQIAVGHGLGHPQRTVDSLKKRGYIQGHVVALNGAIAVTSYSVPIPVHIAWCQWCAEQQTNEDEGETE